MKKLLLVLLVVALASFLLVGCLPGTTPAEGEGEGETEVVVDIAGSVVLDGKTYVSCGSHTITVTFPAPVVGYAEAWVSCCYGDYSEDEVYTKDKDSYVVLFPNEDKTVWTGSGYFGYDCDGGYTPCCATYVEVWAGECEDEACIWFPVIVDCDDPFALIEITADACECEGCEISFESIVSEYECDPDEVCCGDYCSGLASWSVVLYDGDPFDECCDPSICEEPIGSCSGTACPIDCTTACLDAGTYIAVVTLVDNVGNETVYYAQIVLGADCEIDVTEGWEASAPECVTWDTVTTDSIGDCGEIGD